MNNPILALQPHQRRAYVAHVRIVETSPTYQDIHAELKSPMTYKCLRCKDIGYMYCPVPDGETFKIKTMECPYCTEVYNGNP